MAITIIEGDVYRSVATFTDEATGSPVDPTTVSFVYELNGAPGSKVTLVYSGSSSPAPGTVARTATGVYEVQVDTTTLQGFLSRQWVSTGTGQAASDVESVSIEAGL